MAKQKIYLGRPFVAVRPQSGESEFYVENLNDAPFDFLKCEIKSSTSYAPPEAFVTDKENKIIKLKGFGGVPQSTSLEMVVTGVQSVKVVTEEKKVLFDEETKAALKAAPKNGILAGWKFVKMSIFLFVILTIILYALRDTEIGRTLASLNAATGAKVLENFDIRIATNRHYVYETSAFVMVNARYKLEFGDDLDLSKIYNFVGDIDSEDDKRVGFFVMKDVWLDKTGHPLLATKGDAEDYCEKAGGILLNRSELETFLARQYKGVENFFWPITRRAYLPEWANDTYSWMFRKSWLYLKEDGENPTDKNPVNDFVVVGNSIKAAFRCGFSETFYKTVK